MIIIDTLKDINKVCINTNIWTYTLPSVSHLIYGESLHGYLLRLDKLNSFTSGTIVDMIKKHQTSKVSLDRHGLYLIGTNFHPSQIGYSPYYKICPTCISN